MTDPLQEQKELESPLHTEQLPDPLDIQHELPPGLGEHEEITQKRMETVRSPEQMDYQEDPVQTLMSWRAPSRPFRKKDRSFYTTVAVLLVLTALIAFFAGEKMLVAAIFAFGFLVYVLNFIEPEEIDYKISTQGVTTGNHFYHWQELDSFWFSEQDGFKLLHILTQLVFPGILILVLAKDIDTEEVEMDCARFLPFHEIAPKSLIDKWSEGLKKHFPLENPHR